MKQEWSVSACHVLRMAGGNLNSPCTFLNIEYCLRFLVVHICIDKPADIIFPREKVLKLVQQQGPEIAIYLCT